MSKNIFVKAGWILSVSLLAAACSSPYKGDVKLEQQAYAEAITIYQDFLQKHPDAADARRNLGLALMKSGQTDAAITEFSKLVARNARDAYSRLYLGIAHLHKANPTEAMNQMKAFGSPRQPMVEDEVRYQTSLVQTRLAGAAASSEDWAAAARRIEKAVELAIQKQKQADLDAMGADGGGCGGCGG